MKAVEEREQDEYGADVGMTEWVGNVWEFVLVQLHFAAQDRSGQDEKWKRPYTIMQKDRSPLLRA